MTRGMLRGAAAVAVLTCVAGLTGCSGGDVQDVGVASATSAATTAGVTGEPTATGASPSGGSTQGADGAAEAPGTVKPGKADVDLSAAFASVRAANTSSAVDVETHVGDETMTMRYEVQSADPLVFRNVSSMQGGAVTAEILLVGDTVYVKGPGQSRWKGIPTSAFPAAMMQPFTTQFTEPGKYVRTTNREGVEYDIYASSFTLPATAVPSAAGMPPIPAEIWLDPEGVPRHMEVSEVPSRGAHMSAMYDFHWGEPVSIAAPPADQVDAGTPADLGLQGAASPVGA